MDEATSSYDAVVLAGGRGSRLGGRSKPDLVIGGRRLLDTVLAAVDGAVNRVVVGPDQVVPDGVRVTREEPAGSGPCAALAAGVTALGEGGSPWVLVVAVDLANATGGVHALLAAWAAELATGAAPDSLCLQHPDGHRQHLFGIHRRAALLAALERFGDPGGRSVRSLLDLLDPVLVPVDEELLADLDTPADLERWGARSGEERDRN